MKQKIIIGIEIVLSLYLAIFLCWAMLAIGCVEGGRSVEVCRDNSLTNFIGWAYKPFIGLIK